MSIGILKPFIDYTQVGGDTGQGDAASVLPYVNGEDLNQAVLDRPIESLRLRTERIRSALNDQIYLADADRHLLLAGPGKVSWPGPSPGQSGIPTISGNLYLIPFLTPGASGNTPPIGSTFGTLALKKSDGSPGIIVTSRRRSYEGGSHFNVTVGSGGSTTATLTGTPPRLVNITAASGAILNTIITLINGLHDEQGTQALTATLAPGAALGDLLMTTQAQQFIIGNWDAEGHVLTPSAFSSFFATSTNVLQEGDTLAVWYAAMIEDPSNLSPLGALGGRRQSIPENSNTTVPAGSLFNSRLHPERLNNALPICKVINGNLILIDGTELETGQVSIGVGQTAAADIVYAGGSNWADGTTNPTVTVEAQLDKIITDLAGSSDGPARLHATASGIFMTTTGTLRAQLNQLDTALNSVVNNAALENWADGTANPATTLVAQVAKIVHDLANVAVDGAARLRGLASGNFMQTPGTLRAQLNALDTAIYARGFKAAGAVHWNTSGSFYSFDWSAGAFSGGIGGSSGVITMNLSPALSTNGNSCVLVTANTTQGPTSCFQFKARVITSGSVVEVSCFDQTGVAINGSFYVVVFGA